MRRYHIGRRAGARCRGSCRGSADPPRRRLQRRDGHAARSRGSGHHCAGEREFRGGRAGALQRRARPAQNHHLERREQRGCSADSWRTNGRPAPRSFRTTRPISVPSQINNGSVNTMLRSLARARTSSTEAIRGMKQWRPTETTRIAELYMVRAFAEMQLASDYCNGIPLSGQDSTGALIYDTPRPVAYVFQAAVTSADSGLALIPATATVAGRPARSARPAGHEGPGPDWTRPDRRSRRARSDVCGA